MLTMEGCASRRQRLLAKLQPKQTVVLADPIHLRYLANFYVDPFSNGAEYSGLLFLNPDGHSKLYYDARLPKSVDSAHVDEKIPVKWYDGQSPGQGPRRMIFRSILESLGGQNRIHDSLGDPDSPELYRMMAELRRVKDDDEIAVIQTCCRIAEAGQAWARANARAGMTELDVYNGIFAECSRRAGQAVIVYGDFAVSPGSSRKGGPPTLAILKDDDMMILDFSVILSGYRCDFTNTLVIGGKPNAKQQRIFDLCLAAMQAGEKHLRAGVHGKEVYNAVRAVFKEAGVAEAFPHHAGHGIGLAHLESPFLVKQSLETLLSGDVVTLEPGLYIDGVGGLRIEHNYLVTETGYERLSQHTLSLV